MKNEYTIDIYPSNCGGLVGNYHANYEELFDILKYFKQGFKNFIADLSEVEKREYTKQKKGNYVFMFSEASMDDDDEDETTPDEDREILPFEEDEKDAWTSMHPREWLRYKKAATPDTVFFIKIQNKEEDMVNVNFQADSPEVVDIVEGTVINLSYWNDIVDFIRKHGLITREQANELLWEV